MVTSIPQRSRNTHIQEMGPKPSLHAHSHHHHHSHSHSHSHHPSTNIPIPPSPIWWSNTLFFLFFHIAAIYGVLFLSPPSEIGWQTWVLCGLSWQAASFG